MLDVQGRKVQWTGRSMCRRDFLRVGALGMTGLTLAQWLQLKARGEVTEGKARSVIQLPESVFAKSCPNWPGRPTSLPSSAA